VVCCPFPEQTITISISITAARPTTRRQPRQIVATDWNMLVAFSKKAREASMDEWNLTHLG
jgi:hypothetical protein